MLTITLKNGIEREISNFEYIEFPRTLIINKDGYFESENLTDEISLYNQDTKSHETYKVGDIDMIDVSEGRISSQFMTFREED